MTWFASANTASSSGQSAARDAARIGLFNLGSRTSASGAICPSTTASSEQMAHWNARVRGYRGSTTAWDGQINSGTTQYVPIAVKAIVVVVGGVKVPWHLFLCYDLP